MRLLMGKLNGIWNGIWYQYSQGASDGKSSFDHFQYILNGSYEFLIYLKSI